MDSTVSKNFIVDSLNLDCLLPVKAQLYQQGRQDSLLKTNLEFSIQAMEALHSPKRHNACLTVGGDQFLVRITAGTPVLYYTVHSGPNGPQLHQRVKPEARLSTTSLSESHFAGHRCRDEMKSCLEQAKKALSQKAEKKSSFLDHLELKITCGELHLTYSTHHPRHTLHIQPRRRVNLGKTMDLEYILETKAHLENSGEMGKSMLSCLQYLLLNFRNYREDNAQILLQGDGEIIEFVIGKPNKHTTQHFIYTDEQNKAQQLIKNTIDTDDWYD